MAYNKAKEERKWRVWKQSEEKKLRELGVSEEKISKLREYDWESFNSDRRYNQRVQETGTYLDEIVENEQNGQLDIKTVEEFLDSIENEKLHCILITVDKLTLQIAILKIQGFTTRETAFQLNITEKAVYRRMDRLKEKIKIIFA